MAGEIKHRWDGTVLTITSDSGTSSMDLKGEKGKMGIRGPQGRAGVILKEDGSVDMNGYATEAYVIDAITEALEDYTPSGGGGGTGGGGSTNNAVLTVKSTTGWTYKAIGESGSVVLTGEWSSIENEMETGSGTMTLYIGAAPKVTKSIPQGEFSIDATQYLVSGSNTVKIVITDVYGNARTLAFTVNKLVLNVSSTFDASLAYYNSISYTYTPTGDATKIMHFILDGEEIGTAEVVTSGRQQTFTIPMQTHGAHSFEVYFTVGLDKDTVESNHLYYDLIFVTVGNSTPIIACAFQGDNIEQYQTVNIPYVVYNPSALTSEIVLKADGEKVAELTVDRKQQVWSYRVDNYGEVILSITCGDEVKTITLTVTESPINVQPTTENLELYLTSYGRSNNEAEPNKWNYEDITCRFYGYNWVTDGWQLDENGIAVHRVTGDARLSIPLYMFKEDFRGTGKTIEFEFRTRDVQNYDSQIIDCFNNNVGFYMTAQKAVLKSEQSELTTQYKDNEHIRLSFVIEKRAENRLILVYLNGIMSGAIQYPDDDDFSQLNPVLISIGSNDCTIDLYSIRVYNNSLTRYQILDNWIADTQDIGEKAARFTRNNIFDAYSNIVVENLPTTLPYLILTGPELPQYKGNKLSIDGVYVDPVDTRKSFTFTDGEIDVQGTSSAGYARKNYKLKFKNGLIQNGVSKAAYQLRNDSIPTDVFTFKADVASSEGANNVELVRQYNDVCPYKTPPQLVNPAVRQGIDGLPMIIFHNDGNSTKFIGKYNFNFDKASDVFGMVPGDESWELKNNTSDRVNWKKADFSGTEWKNDFEARYPEDNTDTSTLSAFATWVASTDREQATGNSLATVVVYDNVTYAADTAAYRLAKFKNEIHQYAELQSALFFYLFTELYLLIDNRSKNTFPSWIGGDKVCWLPYDMDSGLGIDNVGGLKFDYGLEDTDKTESGADVYNGQHNVFWCNIRDAFRDEIKVMYQDLRSKKKLSYTATEDAFTKHQSIWPEAIWNEDAYYKYLEPLIKDGAGIYLPMLQGSKSEQRKWWLYNRYRYIDSKYNAGDAQTDFITLRGYDRGSITVVPYADIYATILYGSYLEQTRAKKNVPYTLSCPLDMVNDTEIYIYSASQLKSVGDLSSLKVGLADFSMATKLQTLKIGSDAEGYENGNLKSLTLGNNTLLTSLDVRNCTALGTGEQQSVDLSGCKNIKHVYFDGTAIKGVTLPAGGVLRTLHLPNTITNLTIINQPSLEDFVLNDYSNISTLRLENMGDVVPVDSIIRAMSNGGRVRVIGANIILTSASSATSFFDKLDLMRGLDENGNNVDKAQISGVFKVSSDCESYITGWKVKYPNATFEIWMPTFEEMSWTQIDELAQQGLIQNFCSIGDEKTIKLSTGETVTAMIIGFNHDKDDYASTANTIPITFSLKDCLETTSTAGIDLYGYVESNLRQHILSYYDYLPADLQAVIKTTCKEYIEYYERSDTHSWHRTTQYSKGKLFPLAHHEIMGVRQESKSATVYSWTSTLPPQYEYFKQAPIPEGGTPITEGATTGTYYDEDGIYYNAYAIKQLGNTSVQDIAYRTRSINLTTHSNSIEPDCGAFYINSNGSSSSDLYNRGSSMGVTFAFCI